MTDAGSLTLNGGKLLEAGKSVPHDSTSGTFWTDVLSDGTSFGNSEPLVRTINTLMTQGSWETLGPFGNRQPTIVVEIEGENPDALNAGEVWLSALMGSGALEWLPPGHTVWTVFDVIWCYINRSEDDRWDQDENLWKRRYAIPLRTLPHARSPELTVTTAASGTVTDIVVTDGSSATGWTGSYSGNSMTSGAAVTPAVASGAVRTAMTGSTSAGYIAVQYALPAAIPADTPYLRVDARAYRSSLAPTPLYMLVNGSLVKVEAAQRSIATVSGVMQMTGYYRVPAGATAVRVVSAIGGIVSDPYVEVDQIRRVSALPASITGRQKVQTIIPGGSAPAQGSLHVSASTGLGKTLVYTYPIERPSPALTQYRFASAEPNTNAAQVNGQSFTINFTNLDMLVLDTQLPTRGLAALWVKLDVFGGPASITLSVTPYGGNFVVGQVQTFTRTVNQGEGQLVPFGLATLPGTVTGPIGGQMFTLHVNSAASIVNVDEVWAFGMDDRCALTIVDAGTGTPTWGAASNHLWINAPTPEKPAGEVLIGTNLLDARWPLSIPAGPQVHTFPNTGVGILTVTTGATDAVSDFTHYKRWTHHAAETS